MKKLIQILLPFFIISSQVFAIVGFGAYGDFDLLKYPDGTSGEVLTKTWLVKFTDMNSSSTTTTLTFANCKLSVADISKSVEGAVKVDITIVCPDEPT